MTIERLQLYHKKNRRLPERIIVYRDGVSEVRFRLHQSHFFLIMRTQLGTAHAGPHGRASEVASRIQTNLSQSTIQALAYYRRLRKTAPRPFLAP